MKKLKTIGIVLLLLAVSYPLFAEDRDDLKLRALEGEMESMKEEILRQKVVLRQLEETVLFGKITATTAYVSFKNEAEGFFKLVGGEFFLDGTLITKLSDKDLKRKTRKTVSILDGEVPPGEHVLSFKLRYSGKKTKTFTYFENYEFFVESRKPFSLPQGKTKAIEIVVFDKGYFKTELKDRLGVKFNLTTGS